MTSIQRGTFAITLAALLAGLSIAPSAFAADAMHKAMTKKHHDAMHKDAMHKDMMMKKDAAPSQ